MRFVVFFLLLSGSATGRAQWDIQDSHTQASLRGVHSLGDGVAWASGTDGTVLRTEDAGVTWKVCSVAEGAEKLDFRGVQAFDSKTAIVMSSGKGDLSRLYRTTDGCETWKLVFTNPDAEGFWDALQFTDTSVTSQSKGFGVLLGDPVDATFPFFLTYDGGEHWDRQIQPSPRVERNDENVFAASNSSLLVEGLASRTFVTGGKGGPLILTFWVGGDDTGMPDPIYVAKGARPFHYLHKGWIVEKLSVNHTDVSSGAFSYGKHDWRGVIVGGDYSKPEVTANTGWYMERSHPHKGAGWRPSVRPPHGYRSAVAYDAPTKSWITVGPNGTDISSNDGRNWLALRPGVDDAPDADKNWNALSLPFVVGPHGRIGVLRKGALVAPTLGK